MAIDRKYCSRYLLEILNYEFPVTALNSNTFQDASDPDSDPADLCRDFGKWKSNTTNPIDIYIEISDSDNLDCFSLLRTNLSEKAQVYVSGSNFAGISSFADPTFTIQLTRKRNDWIYLSAEPLPTSRYFKISILDETPKEDFYEIGKILCGISKSFPLAIMNGWTDSKESYQKRELNDGQWKPGSENSQLNALEIQFRPCFASRTVKNNEFDLAYEMMTFLENVKTTRPFLFIYNPAKPELYFEYMVIKDDVIEITQSEVDETIFSLSLLELK